MSLDSSNVRVAVTGAVRVGPTSTTAPTDASSTLTGFADLGYVSEDGVTETRDRSTNDIRGWQNSDLVRQVVTESSLTVKCTLIETNKDTVELYYGNTLDEDGKIVVVPSKTGGRKSFVVDVIDGDDFIRLYIPQGEITEVGDQVYAAGEPLGYDVTIAGYPDPSLTDADGNVGTAVKWYDSLAEGESGV